MKSIKKVVSSVIACCAICGALATGAFASSIPETSVTAGSTTTYRSFSFNQTYQEYAAFISDSITRYVNFPRFKANITTLSGPSYPCEAVVVPPASGGCYSNAISFSTTGTYYGDYFYYSPSGTESRPVALAIGFDSRETPGTTFNITGKFYPNSN